MALHVMLFSLAEYVMCSCFFILLHLQYLDCCSDWENFEDIPGDSRVLGVRSLQLAACGGILSAARIRYLGFV
jgi:hypothetical protein